jgi:DNA-binding NarL/FixJ family response regulator
MPSLRILIADDHEIVRHGVRCVLAANGNWEICGEAPDDAAAYALAMQTKPDIVVLDLSMPVQGGVSLAKRLHEDLPKAKLLVYTINEDARSVMTALAAGVRGYVLKSEGECQLRSALAAIGAGRTYFSPSIFHFVVDAAANDGHPSHLTRRELEVTRLIADGHSNKSIARLLGVGQKTVESHRASALRKAGANSGADLVRYAIRHQLIC